MDTTIRGGFWATLLAVLLVPVTALGQEFEGFDDFLERYEATEQGHRAVLAEQFIEWQEAGGGFPIAESSGSVLFFYLAGPGEDEVHLTGDFLARSHFNVFWMFPGESMEQVGQVFYARHRFESDARLDYAYVVDGETTLDPLNPRTIFSGTGGGEVSELVMPEHNVPSEIEKRQGVAEGMLVSLDDPNNPPVTVYLPPGYDSDESYPTLYTADGSAWLELIGLPTILDNLISEEEISPLIVVMIDATENRSSWYQYNPEYLSYLERVIERIDAEYSTRPQPGSRIHIGTSAGGRATVYAGMERPELFEKVALLSPSLSGPVFYWEPYFAGRRHPPRNLSVWMSAGTYEGYIYDDARTMQEFFDRAGLSVMATYNPQGHSFGAWQADAIEALRYFLAPSDESAD